MNNSMNSNDTGTFKVALAGLGAISIEMAPALSSLSEIEVVAVIDKNKATLEGSASLYARAKRYSSLQDCLSSEKDIDCVIVNTPGVSHFDDVSLTLDRGLHCLVAKPLTPELPDAKALVSRAHEVGKTLCVAEQIRFNDHYLAVRDLLDKGLVGDVESVLLLNSKPRPNIGSLQNSKHITLEEMSTHHFDLISLLVGDYHEVRVICDEFNPSWSRYANGGMVNVIMVFDGHTHVNYQGGVCAQAPMYELRIEGSLGALRCRGQHMSYGEVSYEFSEAEGLFRPLQIVANPGGFDPWYRFLRAWSNHLLGGPEPPFSGRRNLKVLELVEAARLSVETEGFATVLQDG